MQSGKKDYFIRLTQAQRGSCFISGGNIAENGGPKAVKYGVVKITLWTWKWFYLTVTSSGRAPTY